MVIGAIHHLSLISTVQYIAPLLLEFIRPVCLPFVGDSKEMKDEAWLKLTGWGFLDGAKGNIYLI